MNRKVLMKKFIYYLKPNDAIIVSNELFKEAYENDRDSVFYMLDSNMTLSFSTGLAMCTDKRVFVFITDGELLEEINAVIQASISRCKNLFCVVLRSGRYHSTGGQPNVFSNIYSPKGLFFNMGFFVHDYTHYFSDKKFYKDVEKLLYRLVGPIVILNKVDSTINKKVLNEEIEINKKNLRERFSNFVANKSLGSSLFQPPSLDSHDIESYKGG
jgi:hypothetical protein